MLLKQGHVIIDTGISDEPVRAACGVYRASVLDNADALMQRRLLVRIPDLSGDETVWPRHVYRYPTVRWAPT